MDTRFGRFLAVLIFAEKQHLILPQVFEPSTMKLAFLTSLPLTMALAILSMVSLTVCVTPRQVNSNTVLDGGLTSVMVELSGPLLEDDTMDGTHGRWLSVDVPASYVLPGVAQASGQGHCPPPPAPAVFGPVDAMEVSGTVEESRGK